MALVVALATLFAGCAAANYDATTALGKQALLDSAASQLSDANCTGAIATLEPVYNSINTDNDVRLMMASSYGCTATIDLFADMYSLVLNAGTLATGGFWAYLALQYPSTFQDQVAEGAQLAEDALASVIAPGAAVLTNEEFNTTSFNPGAFVVTDRLPTANAYLFFASQAAIGALESRYGNPFPSDGLKGNPLPWSSAALVTDDGCAYGSAIINFIDSMTALSGALPGSLATTITGIQSTFETAIYTACSEGCLGTPNPANPLVSSGCGLADCPQCPLALRDRTSCTGAATDPNSCAVAGIVNFINNTPIVGWQTGP